MNKLLRVAHVLAWDDIKQSYRRSRLGQYWITIGMALQIATIAAVFSILFKLNIGEYLPFLATSLILWTYVSTSLVEGARTFIEAETMIRQVSIHPLTYVLRVQLRNLMIAGHNAILIPLALLLALKPVSASVVLFPLGLLILSLNLVWMSSILALISARFRDFPPIVSAATVALFYVTPVMWLPNLLGDSQLAHFLLGLNPFYHLLQIVRQPVLGNYPTMENWIISSTMAIGGLLLAAKIISVFHRRIAYWV